jgi:hypothetical protein
VGAGLSGGVLSGLIDGGRVIDDLRDGRLCRSCRAIGCLAGRLSAGFDLLSGLTGGSIDDAGGALGEWVAAGKGRAERGQRVVVAQPLLGRRAGMVDVLLRRAGRLVRAGVYLILHVGDALLGGRAVLLYRVGSP